eukprot:c10117_g2_i5.p1 GENE.c10117_g2_i5~~c10117_g2_i5.p1  ORF type:complete len:120 (+),score=9.69 c10117_g2_i5:139-498(+)
MQLIPYFLSCLAAPNNILSFSEIQQSLWALPCHCCMLYICITDERRNAIAAREMEVSVGFVGGLRSGVLNPTLLVCAMWSRDITHRHKHGKKNSGFCCHSLRDFLHISHITSDDTHISD